MNKLKSFFSVLLLSVFLLPTAEKVIHELGHEHEDNCHPGDTHYCEAGHECAICDFSFSAFVASERDLVNTSFTEIHKPFDFTLRVTETACTLPFFLRGPPQLS